MKVLLLIVGLFTADLALAETDCSPEAEKGRAAALAAVKVDEAKWQHTAAFLSQQKQNPGVDEETVTALWAAVVTQQSPLQRQRISLAMEASECAMAAGLPPTGILKQQ